MCMWHNDQLRTINTAVPSNIHHFFGEYSTSFPLAFRNRQHIIITYSNVLSTRTYSSYQLQLSTCGWHPLSSHPSFKIPLVISALLPASASTSVDSTYECSCVYSPFVSVWGGNCPIFCMTATLSTQGSLSTFFAAQITAPDFCLLLPPKSPLFLANPRGPLSPDVLGLCSVW